MQCRLASAARVQFGPLPCPHYAETRLRRRPKICDSSERWAAAATTQPPSPPRPSPHSPLREQSAPLSLCNHLPETEHSTHVPSTPTHWSPTCRMPTTFYGQHTPQRPRSSHAHCSPRAVHHPRGQQSTSQPLQRHLVAGTSSTPGLAFGREGGPLTLHLSHRSSRYPEAAPIAPAAPSGALRALPPPTPGTAGGWVGVGAWCAHALCVLRNRRGIPPRNVRNARG